MNFVMKQALGGAQKDLMANMPGKTEVDPEEEKRQQEQLMAMEDAERERKNKWQKSENQREGMRQGIRDKYAIKSPDQKAAEEAAAAAADRTGQIGVPPGLQGMADDEAADESFMGQAEKMLEDTKAKVTEYSDAAMDKVQNCKVSWSHRDERIRTTSPLDARVQLSHFLIRTLLTWDTVHSFGLLFTALLWDYYYYTAVVKQTPLFNM